MASRVNGPGRETVNQLERPSDLQILIRRKVRTFVPTFTLDPLFVGGFFLKHEVQISFSTGVLSENYIRTYL